jgi:benzoate-CoA ligase
MSMNQQEIRVPDRFNFARHVLDVNATWPEKIAYIDDSGTFSYAELEDAVRRFAAGLHAMGLHREERILLIMQDSRDLPVALLGAMYAGIVPVPINTLLPAADYAYMLKHSGARAVITSAALLPVVMQALAETPVKVPLIVSGESTDYSADSVGLHFSALLNQAPMAADGYADTHADQFAFWLYSSGSTGRPKGTVHSHGNLFWTSELYGKPVLGIRHDDVVFSAAKLFFAYGLGNGFTFPLSVGATTVLMAERPTTKAVFQRLTQYKPTLFAGVPTLYVGMLAADDLPPRGETALRICASAGETLPREIGEKFRDHFGCDILDGIGSTEMLHIFLSNHSGDIRYGSTGKPVAGYRVELRDENQVAVGHGEIGDLYIRGPSAALMYWTNREKSCATFLGEWIKSGDKFIADQEGYYYYAGRSDDMLKVSGQYVSPIEIESVLIEHASVLECAVIGRNDESGLTKTVAYVVLKQSNDAGDTLAADLKAFVKSRLAPHKYPREIFFLDDLPKTATGKIQRFKLRDSVL